MDSVELLDHTSATKVASTTTTTITTVTIDLNDGVGSVDDGDYDDDDVEFVGTARTRPSRNQIKDMIKKMTEGIRIKTEMMMEPDICPGRKMTQDIYLENEIQRASSKPMVVRGKQFKESNQMSENDHAMITQPNSNE